MPLLERQEARTSHSSSLQQQVEALQAQQRKLEDAQAGVAVTERRLQADLAQVQVCFQVKSSSKRTQHLSESNPLCISMLVVLSSKGGGVDVKYPQEARAALRVAHMSLQQQQAPAADTQDVVGPQHDTPHGPQSAPPEPVIARHPQGDKRYRTRMLRALQRLVDATSKGEQRYATTDVAPNTVRSVHPRQVAAAAVHFGCGACGWWTAPSTRRGGATVGDVTAAAAWDDAEGAGGATPAGVERVHGIHATLLHQYGVCG